MRRQTPSTIGPCRVTSASNADLVAAFEVPLQELPLRQSRDRLALEDAAEVGDRQPL